MASFPPNCLTVLFRLTLMSLRLIIPRPEKKGYPVHTKGMMDTLQAWYEMAKANSQNITAPRDGKTVYVGSDWKEVTYSHG